MVKRLVINQGDRYGKLTVIKEVEPYLLKSGKKGDRRFLVKCDCGSDEKIVRMMPMTRGDTHSCGCIRISNKTKHGMSNTPTYKTWEMMIQRCTNPSYDGYIGYGRFGIKVCEKWKNFIGFFEDMGMRPDNMTLDRIDPLGNYDKDNCRWATDEIQNFNKNISDANKSGKTGVSWDKAKNGWRAHITKNRKRYELGIFKDFESAVLQRKKAELEHHGFNLKH